MCSPPITHNPILENLRLQVPKMLQNHLKGLTFDKKLDDGPNGTITLRWELH